MGELLISDRSRCVKSKNVETAQGENIVAIAFGGHPSAFPILSDWFDAAHGRK